MSGFTDGVNCDVFGALFGSDSVRVNVASTSRRTFVVHMEMIGMLERWHGVIIDGVLGSVGDMDRDMGIVMGKVVCMITLTGGAADGWDGCELG